MSDSHPPDTPPDSGTLKQDSPPDWFGADPNATAADAPGVPAPPTGAERYELVEEIARGGMGVVYRARDHVFGRDVGLKTLLGAPAAGTAARFREEARITGRLQHPNIPPIHDLGTLPDGRPFLAMKLVDGRTLDALLGEPPDPAHDRGRFVAIFEQIAHGVAFAHSRGVIHRDLKPQNVMVGAFGEVQVMDWGLAKVLADAGAEPGPAAGDDTDGPERTRPGSVFGTPAYMPPEQARGETHRVDARSDVFSLGGVLCAVLTGRPPYVAAGAESARRLAAAAALDDAFARLDGCGAEPDLIALCKRCLAADRDARPPDAGAVAAAVADLREAAERRARQAELDRVRAAERHKRARLALTALAVLVACGGAFAWWERDRRGRRALAEAESQKVEARLAGERDAEAGNRADQAHKGIDAGLTLATDLRRQYRFGAAKAALNQATELARGGAPERAAEVAQAQSDLAFVVELDGVRFRKWVWLPELRRFSGNVTAAREYRQAFASRGLDLPALDPTDAAARVAVSAVKSDLVAAIDDWAVYEANPGDRDRLLEVARKVDPAPWAARLRDPAVRADRGAVAKLAAAAASADPPPGAFVTLAALMRVHRLDPFPLLAAARVRHPTDFELAFSIGQAQMAVNDPRAAGSLDAARSLRPDSVPALLNLGIAHAQRGDPAAGIAALKEARRLAPEFANVHTNLGVLLANAGDLDGALAAHSEGVRLDPSSAPARSGLGFVLAARGDANGAAAAFRAAIRLDPKYTPAHFNLGVLLANQGDADGAVAAYRAAIAVDARYVPAQYNLGELLHRRGDQDAALDAYRAALRADPLLVRAHYSVGRVLIDKGDRDGALAAWADAIRLDPRHVEARYSSGIALTARGDIDGAVAEYREVLRWDPKHSPTLNNLGYILQARGDAKGAITTYKEAIRADPRNAMAHTNLGSVYLQQNNAAEAVASARAAISADPKFAAAHALLGAALQQSGDLAGAREAFTEAGRLDPRWKPWLAKLPSPLPVAPPPREVTRP